MSLGTLGFICLLESSVTQSKKEERKKSRKEKKQKKNNSWDNERYCAPGSLYYTEIQEDTSSKLALITPDGVIQPRVAIRGSPVKQSLFWPMGTTRHWLVDAEVRCTCKITVEPKDYFTYTFPLKCSENIPGVWFVDFINPLTLCCGSSPVLILDFQLGQHNLTLVLFGILSMQIGMKTSKT